MGYQSIMKKIMQQLTEYKDVVDALSASYQSEVEKREKEFEEMRGKYTDEYVKKRRQSWKPEIDYSKAIGEEREKHQRIALAYVDQAKKEMDAYFQVPVNPAFASTVTALKTVGAKISNREFQLLQSASGGYWDRKLLSELSANRTKKDEEVKLNRAGEPERITVDKPIPYFDSELPDVEQAYNDLQNMRHSVSLAFLGYCGMGYELADIVFPSKKAAEETNAAIEAAYGVKVQPPVRDSMEIHQMANSIRCFDKNHSAYTAFSKMMEGLAETMPEQKRKTTLTDSDKNLIDTLISPNYPLSAQGEAVKIAKADSRLAELLSLDARYGRAVKEALREVSENE